MRCLERNKQTFYFAPYVNRIPDMDDYGNITGEYYIVRGDIVKCRGNISASKGEVQSRQFGEDENYDKVIVLEKLPAGLDEYAVLWVDKVPDMNDTDEVPYDYIVKKVAASLNSVTVAISKVQVDG